MLGYLYIICLFQALYLRGKPLVLDVGIKISFIDIILLTFFYFYLIRIFFLKKRIVFPDTLKQVFFFSILLIVIELISVIFLDKGEPRNLTLALSIMRNFILIFLLVNLITPTITIVMFISIVAVINSVIGIFFYLQALNNISNIASKSYLWEPGIFYTLDKGLLRLQGFSDDPNFFFLVNFIGLVASLSVALVQKGIFKFVFYFFSLLLLLTNILTFSRTGFIILLLYFLLFIGMHFYKYYKYIPFLLIVSVGVLVYFFDIFKTRFISAIETGGSGRLDLWYIALDGFFESPIWGQGGRYTLKIAGNYVHNDFLEILSSHGLIGILPIIIMYISLTISFIKFLKCLDNYSCHLQIQVLFKNFILMFLIYLLAHFSFSIFYNPYIWFVIGMLTALKISIKKYCSSNRRDSKCY